MKNKEQIETAQNLIKELQDYVELAKVEKKLKDTERKKVVAEQIESITEMVFTRIKEL